MSISLKLLPETDFCPINRIQILCDGKCIGPTYYSLEPVFMALIDLFEEVRLRKKQRYVDGGLTELINEAAHFATEHYMELDSCQYDVMELNLLKDMPKAAGTHLAFLPHMTCELPDRPIIVDPFRMMLFCEDTICAARTDARHPMPGRACIQLVNIKSNLHVGVPFPSIEVFKFVAEEAINDNRLKLYELNFVTRIFMDTGLRFGPAIPRSAPTADAVCIATIEEQTGARIFDKFMDRAQK